MLQTLDLCGFKTIQVQSLDLRSLNVLIGANGAGKSNLIHFLRLLGDLAAGHLQLNVGRAGGASALLHDGPARTPQLSAKLLFQLDRRQVEYSFTLDFAAGDALVFSQEHASFLDAQAAIGSGLAAPSGHRESQLPAQASAGDPAAGSILARLQRLLVYQFHDTADASRFKQRWSAEDGRLLKTDGGNLAPFLYRLHRFHHRHYLRIVRTITLIAPFFEDFVFDVLDGRLLLQWRERGSDLVFGPHQASDGTLRMMALVALLLQPVESLPSLLVLDEPELGMHPYALEILAGLLRSAAMHTQVVLATQSPALLDHFEPQDVVVVDRRGRASTFHRLEPASLSAWLQEYTLSELWEKNVVGGRPGR